MDCEISLADDPGQKMEKGADGPADFVTSITSEKTFLNKWNS